MWLNEVLPSDFDKTDYCGSNYHKWENRAQQYLIDNGYKVIPPVEKWRSNAFITLEGDSFGPLVRGIKVITPNGERKTLAYG